MVVQRGHDSACTITVPPNPMLSQSSLPLPLQLLLPMAIACLTGLSNAGHPGCFDSNFAFLLGVFMPPPSMAPCTAFIFIIIGKYFDYQLMLSAGHYLGGLWKQEPSLVYLGTQHWVRIPAGTHQGSGRREGRHCDEAVQCSG